MYSKGPPRKEDGKKGNPQQQKGKEQQRPPSTPNSPREPKSKVNPIPLPSPKETKTRSYVEQYHLQSLHRDGRIQARKYTPLSSAVPSKVWNRTPNIKLKNPQDTPRSRYTSTQSRKLVKNIVKTESASGIRTNKRSTSLQQQRPLTKTKVEPGDTKANTGLDPIQVNSVEKQAQPPQQQLQEAPITKEVQVPLANASKSVPKHEPMLPATSKENATLQAKTPESAVVLYQHNVLPQKSEIAGSLGVPEDPMSPCHSKPSTETVVLSPRDVAKQPTPRVSSSDFGPKKLVPKVSSSSFIASRDPSPHMERDLPHDANLAIMKHPLVAKALGDRAKSTPPPHPAKVRQKKPHKASKGTERKPQKVPESSKVTVKPVEKVQACTEDQRTSHPKGQPVAKTCCSSAVQVVPIVSQDAAVQVELKPPLPPRKDTGSETSDLLGPPEKDSTTKAGPHQAVITKNSSHTNATGDKPQSIRGTRLSSKYPDPGWTPGKTKAERTHQDAPPRKKAKSVKSAARQSVERHAKSVTETPRQSSLPRNNTDTTSVGVTQRIPRRPACPKVKPIKDPPTTPTENAPAKLVTTELNEPVVVTRKPLPRPEAGVFEIPSQESLADPPEEFVYFSNVVLLYKAGDKMTGILRLTNHSSDGIFFRLSSCSSVPDRYVIDPKEGKLDPNKRVIVKLTADGILNDAEMSEDVFKIETVKTPATSYTATRRFWMNVNPAKIRTASTKSIMRYHPNHPFFKRCIHNSYSWSSTDEIVHLKDDGSQVKIVLRDLLQDIEFAQQELIRLREMEEGNFTVALLLVATSFFVVFYLLDLLPFSNFLTPQ